MYKVYVLYSRAYGKIYVGYSKDIDSRIKSHNVLGSKGWTIHYRPWELIHTEEFEVKKEAIQRERQLKSAQGRKWIWSIILN